MKIPRSSALEMVMARHMALAGIPEPAQQHRFHPVRRWKFDFAWPDRKIALEVEGGTWVGGRHTRAAGFEADCEKYNAAAQAGWRVFRATGGMVRDGRALRTIVEALNGG